MALQFSSFVPSQIITDYKISIYDSMGHISFTPYSDVPDIIKDYVHNHIIPLYTEVEINRHADGIVTYIYFMKPNLQKKWKYSFVDSSDPRRGNITYNLDVTSLL